MLCALAHQLESLATFEGLKWRDALAFLIGSHSVQFEVPSQNESFGSEAGRPGAKRNENNFAAETILEGCLRTSGEQAENTLDHDQTGYN